MKQKLKDNKTFHAEVAKLMGFDCLTTSDINTLANLRNHSKSNLTAKTAAKYLNEAVVLNNTRRESWDHFWGRQKDPNNISMPFALFEIGGLDYYSEVSAKAVASRYPAENKRLIAKWASQSPPEGCHNRPPFKVWLMRQKPKKGKN